MSRADVVKTELTVVRRGGGTVGAFQAHGHAREANVDPVYAHAAIVHGLAENRVGAFFHTVQHQPHVLQVTVTIRVNGKAHGRYFKPFLLGEKLVLAGGQLVDGEQAVLVRIAVTEGLRRRHAAEECLVGRDAGHRRARHGVAAGGFHAAEDIAAGEQEQVDAHVALGRGEQERLAQLGRVRAGHGVNTPLLVERHARQFVIPVFPGRIGDGRRFLGNRVERLAQNALGRTKDDVGICNGRFIRR
ncbi:MAG: hypothetical protein BWY09_02629 [Candidatus Hydrogenedentes bacterium ADurb.Bin179]|nr:MAG: hypothetical protein BWY09_02629 [Candidatus Hydrogenedentes bacterium ADurb.Bin179]